MKMYNVLLQNYNNYGYCRSKGITVSVTLNILLSLLLFLTSGSIFSSTLETHQQKNSQTISIKNYQVITNTEDTKSQDVQIPVTEPKEIEKKQSVKIPKKKYKKQIKNSTNTVKQNDVKQTNNAMQKTQETVQDNPNIATEATHFGMQNPHPEYPMLSFQRNESGSVTIEYTIAADGTVSDAKVIHSSGFPRLDKMSLITFKKWKFKSALTITGTAINSMPQKITFVFDIHTKTIKEE